MPVEAGDLRQSSFVDVWRDSPVFARLRQGEPGGKCGSCEYRSLCGGCRARAYADSGDYMAEDASCVYEPTGERPVIEPRSVAYGGAVQAPVLAWSPDAEARLARIPGFVRGVVVERIENFARDRGYDTITAEVMDEVRRSMPVDFAKRMPFFMRNGGD